MATSKYTDPAVQNKTQDKGTDQIDELQQLNSGTGKTSDKKKKAYKEGNKDDAATLENNEEAPENNDEAPDRSSYGKRL